MNFEPYKEWTPDGDDEYSLERLMEAMRELFPDSPLDERGMPKFPYYMLKGGKIYKTYDVVEWGEYMNSPERILDRTRLDHHGNYREDNNFTTRHDDDVDVDVSTVFLGMDHGFGSWIGDEILGPYQPTLFETMVFGGDYDQYTRRYTTLNEARKGHWETVDGVINGTLYDEEEDC